ncbi:MAG: methyltransferase domain-containing protein [Gemmatimonas sp.]|nr:methyltransferase domain-containing protein [Gemmatimonas sp.]
MKLRREHQPEEMDRLEADTGELTRSLVDLKVVNRWLGGRRTAVSLILGLAKGIPGDIVRVLDVGTGGADIPVALVRGARARGIALQVTATDLHPKTLAYAARLAAGETEIEVEEADARDLPYADDAFDLVSANTVLHHFSREDAALVLREMARVGRYGMVVTDLSRSRLALAGARLLAATVWRRHPITRHDGPTSVRAAFTPAELQSLAAECLTGRWMVRRHVFFRLSLTLERARSQ